VRRAAKRDAVEPLIVLALERRGYAVAKVSDSGHPDLLVSRGGNVWLIECKDIHPEHGRKRALRGKHDDPDPRFRELTPAQVRWWRRWVAAGGKMPVIVHGVDEALAAVGAFKPAGSDTRADGGAASTSPPSR
jgi:hypothetical protein